MSFPYKKVLVIGATSGIGEALAAKIVSAGSSVIVSGRREERLSAFVSTHGAAHAHAMPFDVTDLPGIPAFADAVAARHPDLDCVVLNSGMQRAFNFSRPDSVDLGVLDAETKTNYTAIVHLALAFIPRLQAQRHGPAALMFTSSGLAVVPMTRVGNYCASKAALHHFVLVLRQQLADNPATQGIKVVEIVPPAVQTELHDDKHQPDLQGKGRGMGMPLDEFTDKAWEGLLAGKEDVPVGTSERFYEEGGIETKRRETFVQLDQMLKKAGLA